MSREIVTDLRKPARVVTLTYRDSELSLRLTHKTAPTIDDFLRAVKLVKSVMKPFGYAVGAAPFYAERADDGQDNDIVFTFQLDEAAAEAIRRGFAEAAAQVNADFDGNGWPISVPEAPRA